MKRNENMTNKSVADIDQSIWVNPKKEFGGNIYVISKQNITSLAGCPDVINGALDARNNMLPTLAHGPSDVASWANFDRNYQLTSLVGGPKTVGGYYSVESCNLTNLDGLPVKIGTNLFLCGNPLTSLRGINQLKEMNGFIYLSECSIKSHILGVFFINGCNGLMVDDNTSAFFERAAHCVNRHIDKGRAGIIPCQQELITLGLYDFANI
jgi:hypothetical protein